MPQIPELPAREEQIRRILENEELFFWRAVVDGKKLISSKLKKVGDCGSAEI